MLLSERCKTLKETLSLKVIDPERLEEKIAEMRALGKSIASLNGSFDLLHAGHLEMLYQASLQADVLIVALNTDRSIQEYKSPLRPIIPLAERLKLIASLFMVDYVTWFDETDPRKILARIRPDVHVNGAEYGENCIEAQVVRSFGGKVQIVSLVEGLSTSQIIKKIVNTETIRINEKH
ncbi:MAG TPA: adenylyltransferase/cytidyltransferase family protein [Rhabdochlamydiaceae bacterium]|jgi:rfaE bifunctional protein nucleotidyltransferase chain/domain